MTDVETGDSRDSQGRTITEADIVAWSGLVHDFTTLHVDAETARTLYFGERIAHGSIALSLAVGLFFPLHAAWYTADDTLESVGWIEVRFTSPVKIGDTLRCTRTVTDVRNDDDGSRVVEHRVEVTNQRTETVLSGRETLRSS